jgi:hypothetical protein
MAKNIFPVGARVYVDGRHEARVAQSFPEGSSSFMFPHYKVHFIGGDQNVAVALHRVGVIKHESCCSDPKVLGGRCDNCDKWIEDSH